MPRPIALVTSQSPEGRVNAAPFSFFNVFAKEPPLVVLGLGISPLGGAKDTTLNIRDTGEFVVNLVDEPIAEAMNLCAIDFPPQISEVEVAGFRPHPERCGRAAAHRPGAGRPGMPALRHAAAGARPLPVIGDVLMPHIRDGILDPASLRVARHAYAPIGRLFGGGYVRTHDRFEMPRLTYSEWLARRSGG